MMIRDTLYKDLNGISVENEIMKAVFLPQNGAKLASLKNKKTGREFMMQASGNRYRVQRYGGDFLQGECSGFDDMFPTIDQTFYNEAPWDGISLPDHGELWALPWKEQRGADQLTFSVYGVRLPYFFGKTVSFSSENRLRISYRIQNMAPFDMECLWAAHIMLYPEKGCRLIFPPGMKKAVCSYSDSGLIGKYGDEFEFPFVPQNDGSVYDASRWRADANDFQKFHFKERVSEGWGKLEYADGESITVFFSKQTVPYLAAIQAEGGKLNLHSVFLEPCTGVFDRPDIAKLHGRNSMIKASGSLEWDLEFEINGGFDEIS